MKRHLSVLVSLFVVAAMMLSLAACKPPEEHEHTFSTDWSKDETNHWHASNCNDSDECKKATADVAAHSDDADGKCTVCGYEKAPETHEHTFSTDWSKDETNHWNAANCNDSDACATAIGNVAAHSYDADGKCDVCGYEKAPETHEHTFSTDWSKDETNHWNAANCNDSDACATAIGNVATHSYGEDGKCTVCEYEKAPDEPAEGSAENPIALTVPGSVTVNYAADADPIWYTFTAAETKTLGVTFSAGAVMGYGVSTNESELGYTDEGDTYFEVELVAGTTYYINFSTADFSAAVIEVSADYIAEAPVVIPGTYTLEDEWGMRDVLTVVITATDAASGTVTFTRYSHNGDEIVENYAYQIVEDAFVFLNADGTAVNTTMCNLVVERGVPTSAVSNGTVYNPSQGGGDVVPSTGFEGTYTATSANGDVWTVVITSDSIEITTVNPMNGFVQTITSGSYTVVGGVVVPDEEDFAGFTFAFNADQVLTGLNESNLGDFTVAVADDGGDEDEDPTGYEGTYTAVGNFASWAITITSTTITAEMSDFIGITTLTATYTVDENGNIVIPTDAGDFEGWVFTFNADKKLTAAQDGNGDEYTVEVPGAPVEGSEEDPIEIEIVEGTTNTVYAATESYTGIYYTFTAGASGILTVTYPEANGYIDLYDIEHILEDIYASSETVYSLEVREGYTYILRLSISVDLEKAPAVTLSFVEQALPNPGDYEKPGDAYDTPLDEESGIVCEFPATEDNTKYYWYKYTSYTGGTITVTFDKAVNVKHGETTLAAVTSFTFDIGAETPYLFGIQTTDLAAANVKFGISCVAPQGATEENPFIAAFGSNNFSYVTGNLYYSFTSENGGTYVVTLNGATANLYSTDYTIWASLENGVACEAFTMTAGQTVILSITNYGDNGPVAVDGTIVIAEGEEGGEEGGDVTGPTCPDGMEELVGGGQMAPATTTIPEPGTYTYWTKVDAGTTLHYCVNNYNVGEGEAGWVLTITVAGEGVSFVIDDATDLVFDYDNYSYVFSLANSGEAAVGVTITYTVTAASSGETTTPTGYEGTYTFENADATPSSVAVVIDGEVIAVTYVHPRTGASYTANVPYTVDDDGAIVVDETSATMENLTFTFAEKVLTGLTLGGTAYGTVADVEESTGYEGEYTFTNDVATPGSVTVVIDGEVIAVTYVHPRTGASYTAYVPYTVDENGAIAVSASDATMEGLTFTFEAKVLTGLTLHGNAYPYVAPTPGSEEAPITLVLGAVEASTNGKSDGHMWYTYTATAEGTVTVTYADNNSWVIIKDAEGVVITSGSQKTSYTFDVVADNTYLIGLGVWNAADTAPAVEVAFAEKTADTPTYYGSYTGNANATGTQLWFVTIDAATVTIKKGSSFYATPMVSGLAYTTTANDDGSITISIPEKNTYSLVVENGVITKLISGSTEYALTKSDVTGTASFSQNVDVNGWTAIA